MYLYNVHTMYVVRAIWQGCVYSEACLLGAGRSWSEYLWTNSETICPFIKSLILHQMLDAGSKLLSKMICNASSKKKKPAAL